MTTPRYLFKQLFSSKKKAFSILISLLVVAGAWLLMVIQTRTGDNEVLFATESNIFDHWVKQYLVERHAALVGAGSFSNDAYYLDQITGRLETASLRLKGDERSIMRARIEVLGLLKPLILAYEEKMRPLRSDFQFSGSMEGDLARLERNALALKEGLAALRDLLQEGKKIKSIYRGKLVEYGVGDWKIDRELRNKIEPWKRNWELQYAGLPFYEALMERWEKYLAMKKLDLETRLKLNAFLRGKRDFWHIEGKAGMIVFTDETLLLQFKDMIEGLQRIEEREKDLFEELGYLY